MILLFISQLPYHSMSGASEDVVKEVCDVLSDSGISARYDARHDSCRVSPGPVYITSDGNSLLIKNDKDTVFLVPRPRKPTKGVDIATGETIVRVPSSSGVLELSFPTVGRKYIRVSYEFDLDKNGTPDGGAFRTFH